MFARDDGHEHKFPEIYVHGGGARTQERIFNGEKTMTSKRKPVAAFFLAGLASLPPCANAAMVLTQPAPVVRVESYTDFASGDVIFTINLTVAGCTGFWLQPTDAGFKQTYAALMMAKAAQLNVVVYAYDNQLWPGSGPSVPYCKVRSVTAQ